MYLRRAALTGLCLILSANAAVAGCIGPRDAAALRVASLQQRLMVAGLACPFADASGASDANGAADAYNHFVLAHRPELQRSDDDLKAYFISNGGESGYDSYKTRLANLAAHGPATDRNAFCAATGDDFRALAASGDLQDAAAGEKLLAGEACEAPVVAAKIVPVRVARNEDVVAPSPRELPDMPYADAPPPRPQRISAAAVATREDFVAAPQPMSAGRRDSDRYWYYRSLYARRD